MTAHLRTLLHLLGREPGETIAIGWDDGTGFRAARTTVARAPEVAALHAETDCWFSIQPLHPRVSIGRGTARDIIGLRTLYADLDVKPGGLPSEAVAADVIADLSRALGTEPMAVVYSGHGLQPYWPLERGSATDWPDETDPRWSDAQALLRRWGRLVGYVANTHGGMVDSVYDLARMLRVPGTVNRKAEPVAVTLSGLGGRP